METIEQREFMKRLFSALGKKGHLHVLEMLCSGLKPFTRKRGQAGFQWCIADV